MAFIQIIEYKTSKADEMQALGEKWEAASEGDRKARQRILCEDRDQPGRFFNIVRFDSYEEAMQNSELPVTQEFAGKMMELVDGAPTFYNLDVREER